MDYSFFDYKYNISGYHGEDFSSLFRILYPVFSFILIFFLLRYIRKGRKDISGFLKILSVCLIIEEICKISWESYWDITTGQGFNAGGILPFETCSIFLYVLPVAAFGRGKAKRCALAWMSSIGVLSGFSYMLFPMVLKWYPFFSYGAFHSLIYHFMMVFTGLAAVISREIRVKREDTIYGFIPQLIMACIVIPLDYLFGWDYMLLRNASGIPLIEKLAGILRSRGFGHVTTILVMILYLFMEFVPTAFHCRFQRRIYR